MLAWLWFLVAFFPAYFVHELGHVVIGWLQGAKGAVTTFGRPGDRLVVFSYPVNSFRTALAFWGAMSAVFPLVPLRYRQVGVNSDGLAIANALRAMVGKKPDVGPNT